MNLLPRTTQRRLQKIPQIASVWEGDRRPLSSSRTNDREEEGGECVIWVDGSEACVRAMDVVSPEAGPEAMVRTLLRAIETPQNPARPARPKKIIVRDRETQFFLRGVLQDLEIAIDYVPELPLIDELFRGFEEFHNNRPPALPEAWENALVQTARELWKAGPWELMADYDIVEIAIDRPDLPSLYACVMGMLGREYGVILYRSLDSLKRFRQAAIEEKSMERMEKAFLSQDCWFLSYELDEDEEEDEDEEYDLADFHPSLVHPVFGSVHPYEGIRPYLDEEEARVVYIALNVLLRFFKGNQNAFSEDPIPELHKRFRVPSDPARPKGETVSANASTLPELREEFVKTMEESGVGSFPDDDGEDGSPLKEDLVPDNAHLSLGMVPWHLLEQIRERPNLYHQARSFATGGEGFPVVMIQTSRPKAKEIIEKIQQAGGLAGIGFNPGEDPFDDTRYDLGILKMGNGDLYLFGEFEDDDPDHRNARRNWDRRCKSTKGHCGLIIAMGVTGSSRGNPQLSDMLGLFETKTIDSKDLDLGVLTLMSHFG
ncbi:hypothetical protein V0288_05875 [Pannus brasiliensis CCIBt3594]|uniref:Uncharacterized protein n=1 Tax=Pannus brasiliensis CCIBt3594 TaxID=1427578 RepID=A0AAW9QRU3_9CHRO